MLLSVGSGPAVSIVVRSQAVLAHTEEAYQGYPGTQVPAGTVTQQAVHSQAVPVTCAALWHPSIPTAFRMQWKPKGLSRSWAVSPELPCFARVA
eukprot:1626299-Rhodomonas_salina.1